MLPQFLISSYEQYKADTDFVASWLVNTATEYGYAALSETPIKPRRLKGRARKLSREAKTSSVAASGRHESVFRVHTRDFVPLAQFIAKSTEPGIEVPVAFANRLKRAIRMRRQHESWHSKHNQRAATTDAKDGHGYFVGLLEQVQAALQPNLVSITDHNVDPKIDPETTSKDSDDDRDFQNRFHVLTLEDTAEMFDQNEVQDELNTTKDVQVVNDPSTNKDEELIAAMYLFKDLHQIRIFVRHLWELYAAGNIDLVATALTTNTAIDFVRKLQEDFETTFVDQIQLNENSCLYCAMQADMAVPSGPIDYARERCLAYPRKFLSTYLRDVIEDTSGNVPTVASPCLELYDQMEDRADMAIPERLFRACHGSHS